MYELPSDEEIARLARRPLPKLRTVLGVIAVIGIGLGALGGAYVARTSPLYFASAVERRGEVRDFLVSGGYEDVVLRATDEDGLEYAFSGYRRGERCEGNAHITLIIGSTALGDSAICGLPESPEQATASCARGRATSCAAVATFHRTAEPPRFTEAAAAATTACEAGDAHGCFELGLALSRHGQSSEDAARAVAAYRKGCEGGSAGACNNLGVMLRHADGVAQDDVAACDAFEKGCNGSSEFACGSLGQCFELGRGRTPDHTRAFTLYTQSCSDGNVGACVPAAIMRLEGLGTARDVEGAVASLRLLCEDDTSPLASACLALGMAYERGPGVPVDEARARMFFARSCELGERIACRPTE